MVFELICCVFLPRFRYHCHTLLPVSRRAVEMVTLSKVLWTGTQVPSCQHTNFQVFGTLLTRMAGNTATTVCLRTHNKVCHHRVRDDSVVGSSVLEVNLMWRTSVSVFDTKTENWLRFISSKNAFLRFEIFQRNTDKAFSSLGLY